ncbi:PP2C family protein-serine/threonine phosphatase [Streptomyces sp900105245]|uniref:PP2C family protein-serine/threonine phosphatase n=1 Tax=Streptomyces sp. 900105245 TaxID=3154379 RepID=UPI00332CDCE4
MTDLRVAPAGPSAGSAARCGFLALWWGASVMQRPWRAPCPTGSHGRATRSDALRNPCGPFRRTGHTLRYARCRYAKCSLRPTGGERPRALRAAITMSQLRDMLRGIGCDRQEPPGRILQLLDLAHDALYPQATATCLYALLDENDGGWTISYSSAGHPPPLLVTHEGDTRYLAGGRGLLLGVDPSLPRHGVFQ